MLDHRLAAVNAHVVPECDSDQILSLTIRSFVMIRFFFSE